MRLIVAALALASLTTIGCGPATAGAGGADTADEASDFPKAPDFTLQTLDGDTVTLSDFEGDKVVLIDFWATTCDPCLAEMPELLKLYDAKKPEGFEVLAINTDGPETRAQVSQTVAKMNMIFPIPLDEETTVMDRFNPKGAMPFTCVIDRSGHVVFKRVGYQPGDESSWKKLLAAVEGALAK